MKKLLLLLLFTSALQAAAPGLPPLITAINNKDMKSVINILNNDPEILHAVLPVSKTSVLSWAVYTEAYDIAELLIMRGADINAQDNFGWTPLMRAIMLARPTMVQLLLSHNADISVPDNEGVRTLNIPSGWAFLRSPGSGPADLDDRIAQIDKLLAPYRDAAQQEEKAATCPQ